MNELDAKIYNRLQGRILDSKRLENYLRLKSRYGDLSLIPEGASNIRVWDIKKLSGHMANNLSSFLLTFEKEGLEQQIDLVLKAYRENVAFNAHRPDEDIRKYVREFQALKSLESVGFPVPKAYFCECDSFFLGYPFVIMHKEQVIQGSVDKLDCFAATLARLHNLKVTELGIKALKFPKDASAFAREWQICLKYLLIENRHYRFLKKDFNYAINWLESNASDNICPKYCLIHGEYHPGHTVVTIENRMKVIDWEGVEIGDPAFDVGYAYHVVKLMNNEKNPNSGERSAKHFVSEYTKKFNGDIHSRLKFYQVVGVLRVAIAVSSWISNPIEAYRRFGYKSLARALAFPFFRSQLLAKKWLNEDFLVSYLQYCQDFIETTLR
jgi:aminoglycoside phosphotransferase (APT) family kinase protein